MTQNVFETISSQYFDLTHSEKKVADYVLGHRIDAQYMSISELAEEFDPPVTKSCLNHRLRKLVELSRK